MMPSKKKKCLTCGSLHSGRVGAGKFCSIACSKRVGARARWSGYKRASDKRGNDKRGKGAGSSRRAPPPPPSLPIVPLVGPEDAAEDGLRGEHVVVTVQTAKAASVRVRGVVKEYSDRSDKHCVVDARGRSYWVDLRHCSVVFVDEKDV